MSMRYYYLIVPGLLLCAAAHLAGLPMPARMRMKDGRVFDCTVLERTDDGVVIERRFGVALARETHRAEQIESMQFPVPGVLTSINVRALSDKEELRNAVREVEAEYTAWQQFADIKGNYALPLLKLYAELLERRTSYATAQRMYRRLLQSDIDAPTRLMAQQRLAICAFWSSDDGAALPLLTNALAAAQDDAGRAELIYCIGVSHAQRGEAVPALFALLKNSVFYSMHGTWEPRSLTAALGPFAALDRRDEYLHTCATLTQRFAGTVWDKTARRQLAALDAGTNLSSLSSLTMYLEDK